MLRKFKSPLSLLVFGFLLLALLAGTALQGRAVLAAPVAQTATAIRVNQVGYLANLPKLATVVSTSTSALTWQLKNSGGTVVASGSTSVYGADAASGDSVHIADFSTYTTAGTGYTLVVGSVASYPFDISATVYKTLKYDALAYFYHNRSGIAITMPYAGGSQWTRPAGHIGVAPNLGDTNVPCASDAGCSYSLNVSGGWYDAGDQGKYVVNGGISVWTMLNQYERMKYLGTSSADFANGKMNIPENANGVADILDEARWEMEFLLKMQVPTGQTKAGMVHHKMHDAAWTGIPLRPDQDPQQRVLRPVSTAATLNLAATAAQCARIWASIDATFSNKCLTAAQTAWTAAVANPSVIASNSDGTGGGSYGDSVVADEFYWAAAELYITTGSSTYLNYLTSSSLYKVIPASPSSMNWGSVQALGDISLAVVPNSLPAADVTSIRNNIVTVANGYVSTTNAQGYRLPFAGGTGGAYYWGDNSDVANNGIILALAYDFTNSAQYLNAANEAMNYLLGRNAMNKSYVSGYGENPLTNPHHRFWANQANSSFPLPPPGALSGGPNSGLDDPYAAANLGGCKPQKCYVDNYQAYAVNEITINWNAPLAWLASYLDEKGGAVAGPTPTFTAVVPATMTATSTRTFTPGPTFTPTNTSVVTSTRTSTPVTPTNTPTTGGALKVQMVAGGTDNTQQTAFNLQLMNIGSSAVSNISARIYFTTENSNAASGYVLEKYYDQSGISTVSGPTLLSGSTYYYTINFGTASLPAGGNWAYNTGMHLSSWASTYSATNDFWHGAGTLPTAFVDWASIPLYVNGSLVWGSEPGGTTPTITPTRTSTAIIIADGPDLVVVSATYVGSSPACANAPKDSIVVKNQGFASTGSFVVSFGAQAQTVSGLAPGESATLLFNAISSGTVTVDSTNVITEVNETNNTLTVSLAVPTQAPTCTPTSGPSLTPTRTSTPTITKTATPIDMFPTNTLTRTPTVIFTNTPTPTTGGGTCTPTSSITAPFTYDGAGTFCWQASTLANYINSWNTTSVSVNGTNYTNLYVSVSSLPAKIGGYWYISYNSSVAWAHFEAK